MTTAVADNLLAEFAAFVRHVTGEMLPPAVLAKALRVCKADCEPGQTAEQTGCTPQSGPESKLPTTAKPVFKVKPPKKLYRGVMESGKGAGTFSLGRGLYSTPSRGFLRGFKYDKIIELTPEQAFPRNPLMLRNPNMFSDWLLQESGMRRMSEFNAKYPDPGEFVQSRGYDGVWAGDEVVRYMPQEEKALELVIQKGFVDRLPEFQAALDSLEEEEQEGLYVWYQPGPPVLVIIDQMDWHDGSGGKKIKRPASRFAGDEARVIWQNEGGKPDPKAGWVQLLPREKGWGFKQAKSGAAASGSSVGQPRAPSSGVHGGGSVLGTTEPKPQQPIAAGLAVVADDTGRVLMLQRQLDPADPNSGKWEFPGGKIDDGETPEEAALREWEEETGLDLPQGIAVSGAWPSGNGKYVGFVCRLGSEGDLDLAGRRADSDPDSGGWAAVAWVNPADLPHHNLRPALLGDIDEVMAAVAKWLLKGRVVAKAAPESKLPTTGDPIKIELPELSQSTDYSCGASLLQAICNLLGVGPQDEAEFIKLLPSDPQEGTDPSKIIALAHKLGLDVHTHNGMTLEELKDLMEQHTPTMVLIQAWGDPTERAADYPNDLSGHYVAPIGYDDRFIYFADPALEGTRGKMPPDEFLSRWHDQGVDGRPYTRYGIALSRPTYVEPIKESIGVVKKARGGPCTPGHTAARDQCVPESGPANKLPVKPAESAAAGGERDPRIGTVVPAKEHAAVVKKAKAKLAAVPEPTAEEKAEAAAGLAKLGANKYRRNLVGNTTDRRKRREKPPDGTEVEAICLPSDEYDREAHQVSGVFRTIPSPFGPPPNCWVGDLPVDPETVKPASNGQPPAKTVRKAACEPGETAAKTGCTPREGPENKLPDAGNQSQPPAQQLSSKLLTRGGDAYIARLIPDDMAKLLAESNASLNQDARRGSATGVGVTRHGEDGPVVAWPEGNDAVALHEFGHALMYPRKVDGQWQDSPLRDQAFAAASKAMEEYKKPGLLRLDTSHEDELWADLVAAYTTPGNHLLLRESMPATYAKVKDILGDSPLDVAVPPALATYLASVAQNGWPKKRALTEMGLTEDQGDELADLIRPESAGEAQVGSYADRVARAAKLLSSRKRLSTGKTVQKAPCKPGERADLTGCTPSRPGKTPTSPAESGRGAERLEAAREGSKSELAQIAEQVRGKLGISSGVSLRPSKAMAGWYDKLPASAKQAADMGMAVHHAAEKFYAKNQKLALEVAREHGLNPKQVADLSLLLTAVDTVARWGLNWQVADTALAALGGPVALAGAKASYYLPVGSALAVGYYLASGALKGKNPLATLKAARGRVKEQLAKEKPHKSLHRVVTKAEGTCEPGQTSAQTGCTPAEGPANKLPTAPAEYGKDTADPDVDPQIAEFVQQTARGEIDRVASSHPAVANLLREYPINIHVTGPGAYQEHPRLSGSFDWKTGTLSLASENADLSDDLNFGAWTVGGTGLAPTIRHELGHHALMSLDPNKATAWFDMLRKHRNALGELGPKVSKYASESPAELFAESFAAWSHPGYQPGMLPKLIEDALKKSFPRKRERAKEKQHDKASKGSKGSNGTGRPAGRRPGRGAGGKAK